MTLINKSLLKNGTYEHEGHLFGLFFYDLLVTANKENTIL
jgi:hypothetical protein